jgi:hypothetical protein
MERDVKVEGRPPSALDSILVFGTLFALLPPARPAVAPGAIVRRNKTRDALS